MAISKGKMEENIKTVLKLHQMQVKALFEFIGLALDPRRILKQFQEYDESTAIFWNVLCE